MHLATDETRMGTRGIALPEGYLYRRVRTPERSHATPANH